MDRYYFHWLIRNSLVSNQAGSLGGIAKLRKRRGNRDTNKCSKKQDGHALLRKSTKPRCNAWIRNTGILKNVATS